MKFIAHRGYHKKGVQENTMIAFENAVNDDYFYGFELDVQETKDQVFVVLHDPVIDRVSNGIGQVKNYKYKDLLKYNFGTKEHPSKILKLKTVLDKFDNKLIIVELKGIKNIKKLFRLLNNYNNIYVASFNSKLLHELIKLKPKFKIGIFNNILNSEEDYGEYDFIGIYQRLITNSLIKYFLNKDIEMFAFGIRNNSYIKKIDKDKLSDMYFIIDNKITKELKKH